MSHAGTCKKDPVPSTFWIFFLSTQRLPKAAVGHRAIRIDVTPYMRMSLMLKFTFKFTLTFTSAFLLEVITWAPFRLGS